jgi:hypothetical protein
MHDASTGEEMVMFRDPDSAPERNETSLSLSNGVVG